MAAEATALGGLNRLSPLRQLGLLVLVAGAVALGVTVALWSRTPNYTLLYGSLAGRDASQVLEALRRADIPVRVEEGSGAILVPSVRVHEARLELAGEGLPRGADLGFQVLEAKRAFGTSEFMERARYHRALEVELARSIASLRNVESARVHLALPRQSVFVRNARQPSASVLVKLYPGRGLEEGEGNAIANLVAAAVPYLEPSAVRVIDHRGRLLTSADTDGHVALSNKEFEYTARLEAAYVKRIENILVPIVGAQGVRAQLTAELDFTRTEQASERFTPNPEAIRSERVSEERGGEGNTGGVPGALSNQPPAATSVPETVQPDPTPGVTDSAQTRSRRQSTKNFELDRTLDHTVAPTATIRRLSVAVVVDDTQSVGEDGKVSSEPRSSEEMTRITDLVKEAIGFNEQRGDTVNVVNAAFTRPPEPLVELPPVPMWKQSWVLDLAKQAAGGLLILIVAFGLLRPMMRNLVNRDLAELEITQAEQARLAAPQGASTGMEGEEPASTPALGHAAGNKDLDAIKTLVAEDPKRVANVMKTWVENG